MDGMRKNKKNFGEKVAGISLAFAPQVFPATHEGVLTRGTVLLGNLAATPGRVAAQFLQGIGFNFPLLFINSIESTPSRLVAVGPKRDIISLFGCAI